MGIVWRAFDEELQREVAIKFAWEPDSKHALADLSRSTILRFLLEAHVTGQLEHPGIVPVHEVGVTEEDRLYMTMKLVRGRTLEELVKEGADDREFSRRESLEALLRLADALEFAHRKGVVHRDLKPANVMVGEFGEVQLMDWGLARAAWADTDSARDATSVRSPHAGVTGVGTGAAMGTPAYMAPEMAGGDLDRIGPATDVFGMGGLLYFHLYGRPPYGGDKREAEESAVAGDIQFPVRGHDGLRTPHELRGICRRAMAREPEDRYANAGDFGRDIRAYLEGTGGSGAWRDPLHAAVTKWVRRHPRGSLVAVLLPVMLILAVRLGQLAMERGRDRLLTRLEEARDTSAEYWNNRKDHHFRVARSIQEDLVAAGLPADLGEGAAERVEELRRDDEALHGATVALIIEFVSSLQLGGVDHAALGGVPATERDAERQKYVLREHSDLVEIWPAAAQLVCDVQLDPLALRLSRALLAHDTDSALELAGEFARGRTRAPSPVELETTAKMLWDSGFHRDADALFAMALDGNPRAPWPHFYRSRHALDEGRLQDGLLHAYCMRVSLPDRRSAAWSSRLTAASRWDRSASGCTDSCEPGRRCITISTGGARRSRRITRRPRWRGGARARACAC